MIKKQYNRKPRTDKKEVEVVWTPRTELGRLVKAEKIASLDNVWEQGKVIKEPEIVNFFLKDLEERVLKIGKGKRPFRWVQRMTDSGRRSKYVVAAAVGNKDGYVGVGVGRAKAYGDAIASALRQAKLSIINVYRGCGSWDCNCKKNHSISTEVSGKCGSVIVTLMPAPQGSGLSVSSISRDILELAGVADVWSVTKGHTKTRTNTALAVFEALKQLSKVKTLRPRTKRKMDKLEKEEKKIEGSEVEGSAKKEEKPVKPKPEKKDENTEAKK